MTELDYSYEGELDLDALKLVARNVPLTGTDLTTLASAVPTLIRRLEASEKQVSEVRRVVKSLKEAEGSIYGVVVDEVRKSVGNWIEAALEGQLDPEDARVGKALGDAIRQEATDHG